MTPIQSRCRSARVVLTIALCVMACLVPLAAQQGPAKPQGPAAPLSFATLHTLQTATDALKAIAAANPAITELMEIGRSTGDRPIHVLVVSNMKKGATIDALVKLQRPRTPAVNNVKPMKPYQGKPGQWIDGGMHANDRAGTEACLYIIDKLVSGYGTDAEIAKLVDDNAFYICPVPNPDGLAATGDGKPVKADAAADANGNFPEGWWKDDNTPGGTGAYPSSLAEARWILEFFTNHTNILLAQSFDSGGKMTMKPYGRWPEGRVGARDLAVFDGVIGKKYLELIGETTPARGWRSPYNTDRGTPSGYGLFVDWAYGQFGSFAMSTQLPDAQREVQPKAYETAWQFERYKATLLPRVEITDATAKVLYTTNQATQAVATADGQTVTIKKSGAPGRYKVIQVTATIENTGALPTQVASGTTLRGNREDVIWLLGATGKITFLEGSRWLRLGVLQGTLALPGAGSAVDAAGGRGGGGGGRGGRGGGGGTTALSQMREQRPETPAVRQSGNRRVVTWLVAVEGDQPLSLALTSQKGGTRTRDLAIQ